MLLSLQTAELQGSRVGKDHCLPSCNRDDPREPAAVVPQGAGQGHKGP